MVLMDETELNGIQLSPPHSSTSEKKAPAAQGKPAPSMRLMLIDAKDQPWSRRENESAKAYALFLYYVGLSYQRSIALVVKNRKVARGMVNDLCAQNQWVVRAAAFDAALERERTAEIEASRRRQSEMEAQVVERLMQMALLSATRQVEAMRDAQEGSPAYALDTETLTELTDTVVKLSRLQRGEPTDHSKVEGESVADILVRRLDELAQRTQERSGVSA